MLTFRMLFCLLTITAQPALAQNSAQHIEDGIVYELQTLLFVYEPKEDIRIIYQVSNIAYPEVNFRTGDYNLGRFFVSARDSTVEFESGSASSEVEHRLTTNHNTYSGVQANVSQTLTAEDGDTLLIQGEPRFYTYIVGLPAPREFFTKFDKTNRYYSESLNTTLGTNAYQPRYDLNKDGIINFTDWLIWMTSESDVRQVPPGAQLSLKVFVRNKTADINRDGHINEQDLNTWMTTFGTNLGEPNYSIYADLTGNGKIDIHDFTMFSNLYTNKN